MHVSSLRKCNLTRWSLSGHGRHAQAPSSCRVPCRACPAHSPPPWMFSGRVQGLEPMRGPLAPFYKEHIEAMVRGEPGFEPGPGRSVTSLAAGSLHDHVASLGPTVIPRTHVFLPIRVGMWPVPRCQASAIQAHVASTTANTLKPYPHPCAERHQRGIWGHPRRHKTCLGFEPHHQLSWVSSLQTTNQGSQSLGACEPLPCNKSR